MTRYLWIETKLTIRNVSFLAFTIALPVVLFMVYAGVFGGEGTYSDGTPVSASLMVSMAGYGAMGAALSTGAQVAFERAGGWQRQLRLTRLSSLGYITAKAVVAMLVAVPIILIVTVLGVTTQGVTMSGPQWLAATAGLWAATLPFALLGLAVGMLAGGEAAGAIAGMLSVLLGFAGGMFFPSQLLPEWGQTLMKIMPSYWMRDLGQAAFADSARWAPAIAVLAGYTILLTALTAWRYVRNTRT